MLVSTLLQGTTFEPLARRFGVTTSEPALPRPLAEGGTIPVGLLFKRTLGIDTLFVGFGLPDDRVHSPNEKFCLADFHRGIKSSARLWEELAKIKTK